ncbi:MAG: hypothetical protein IIT65_04415 [Lachnospiraceae bacterium]|nr:hypothetical protein [Lachnospiraceae bacterium]
MQAGQRLVAADGYEVALFPMPYLYMTQDEGGDTSHQGTYNLDFIGWNGSSKVYNAPLYAPCTMKVVNTWLNYSGGNAVFFESVNKVHLANGTLDYLTIFFAHDPNPPYTSIGQVVQQGQICYHTGEYGIAYGDHVHSCCGQGRYQGTTVRPTGHTDLTNRIHYWDGVYVNDTTIVQGYGHNWRTWSGPTPPTPSREKFPWVLYARKLREGRWEI